MRFDDDVIVERFIEGKEISVAVIDGKPLGAIEIVPRRGVYDFQINTPRAASTPTSRRDCPRSATARY